MFLAGAAAIPLLWKFFNKWPNPDAARRGDWEAIAKLMTPLGLHEKRAHTIIRFSSEYTGLTWVKVFRIIPEFRILRLTLH